MSNLEPMAMALAAENAGSSAVIHGSKKQRRGLKKHSTFPSLFISPTSSDLNLNLLHHHHHHHRQQQQQQQQQQAKQHSSGIKIPSGDGPYVRAKQAQLVEKDVERAVALFWSAINVGDRVDSALKDMAVVMKQQGRSEEAIEAIRSFRHRCSSAAQESLDNLLLDLYKKCGRLDDQIELLKHKLSLIHKGLIFNGKRTKTARSQGKKFQISIRQEASRLLGNLGWAYMQLSNFIAAEIVYRKALLIEPDNNKLCNLGVCLMKQERYNEARVVLRGVMPISPNGHSESESQLRSFERAQALLMSMDDAVLPASSSSTPMTSSSSSSEPSTTSVTVTVASSSSKSSSSAITHSSLSGNLYDSSHILDDDYDDDDENHNSSQNNYLPEFDLWTQWKLWEAEINHSSNPPTHPAPNHQLVDATLNQDLETLIGANHPHHNYDDDGAAPAAAAAAAGDDERNSLMMNSRVTQVPSLNGGAAALGCSDKRVVAPRRAEHAHYVQQRLGQNGKEVSSTTDSDKKVDSGQEQYGTRQKQMVIGNEYNDHDRTDITSTVGPFSPWHLQQQSISMGSMVAW